MQQRYVYFLSFLFLMLAFIDPSLAVTDADFREEITRAEKLITGGYLRLGLFGLCFVAGAIAIVKQNWMMLVTAVAGVLFIYLMKGWITANFAILI